MWLRDDFRKHLDRLRVDRQFALQSVEHCGIETGIYIWDRV